MSVVVLAVCSGACTKTRRFTRMDNVKQHVRSSVSNDNAERCGLEVRRLSMPVPQVIEQWCAECVDASTK
jgi:hypothetical protein